MTFLPRRARAIESHYPPRRLTIVFLFIAVFRNRFVNLNFILNGILLDFYWGTGY